MTETAIFERVVEILTPYVKDPDALARVTPATDIPQPLVWSTWSWPSKTTSTSRSAMTTSTPSPPSATASS